MNERGRGRRGAFGYSDVALSIINSKITANAALGSGTGSAGGGVAEDRR